MRVRNVKNKDEILKNCPYVVNSPEKYKGKWEQYFKNNNPIFLEIGPGKCSFIKEMAKLYPNINFVGVERIDSVLALGVCDLEKSDYKNLALINYDANDIDSLFNNEVEEIYLNFSDPWPKKRHEKRRLTSFSFLKKYDIIFKGDRNINLKTDNKDLFEYSIISLSNYGYALTDVSLDLHSRDNINNVMTEYEKKFSKKGYKIYYLKAIKNI